MSNRGRIRWRGLLRRFSRTEDAAVALETVIITPLLIWAFMASFVFFDAYRAYSTSVKATYMVADMISRQTDLVYQHDIQGMTDVIETIIRSADRVQLRASQIGVVSGARTVEWSYGVNGAARIFDADLPGIEDMLPNMPEGERIILVETFVDYTSPLNVGLTVVSFENFTVARPRYAGQVPCCATGTPPAS
jgi:hypothetical protein